MKRISIRRHLAAAAFAAAAGMAGACSSGSTAGTAGAATTAGATTTDTAHGGNDAAAQAELSAADLQAVADVRKATARFQDIRAAKEAGYTVQHPAGCAASSEGGQGFHWLNESLVDDKVELLAPELVMYEPQPDGTLKLVGVDYVVPYKEGSSPPKLLGREFMHNVPLEVWALHIWAWEPNERGMFAAWNPAVSCDDVI